MPEYDVLCIVNAIVDIIAQCDEAFLETNGIIKGAMKPDGVPDFPCLSLRVHSNSVRLLIGMPSGKSSEPAAWSSANSGTM